MNELYNTVYPPKVPIVDGLIYGGTYLFADAPKVGKLFLIAQFGYHVSMGIPLWNYPVHQGTVLYLALEDDYSRLQKRLSRMFGMESSDSFDMISGTNVLLGAADGAFIMQKEKRTENNAVIDIAGRDQQLEVSFNREKCLWKLTKSETELWKEPDDPVIEAVSGVVSVEKPVWTGTASELLALLPSVDIQLNELTRKMNISMERLLLEKSITYESTREHSGRMIKLTLEKAKE